MFTTGPSVLTITYIIYIVTSAALTVWVAHSLSTRGRIFLVQFMESNEQLADSINHLLVVGFYLVNLGYAMLALSYGHKPLTLEQAIESLSFKIGLVLVVLGVTHFFNMSMIGRWGYRLDAAIRRMRTGANDAPAAQEIAPAPAPPV
jgi:hypothetical protein